MGGLFGSNQIAAPAPIDYTPIYKEMELAREQMVQQQKDAEAAQKEALTKSQDMSASQGMNQSNFTAQQGLGRQQAYQQAVDFMAADQAQKAATAAGQAETGGGINFTDSTQAKLNNLGAISSGLPQTQANRVGLYNPQIQGKTNYGAKTAPISSFTMPDTSNISLGGGY